MHCTSRCVLAVMCLLLGTEEQVTDWLMHEAIRDTAFEYYSCSAEELANAIVNINWKNNGVDC